MQTGNKQLHALLIEDDASFKRILEIRLKAWREDLKITVAATIAAARGLLDQMHLQFDFVILDQHLPDGMGWQLLEHPRLRDLTVLAVSSDEAPELPGQTVLAGAQHFLAKRQVTEALFIPLLEAMLERKGLELKLVKAQVSESRLEAIKVLLATLRHEINNPLGAVLGGAYLVRSKGELATDQIEALKLIESSGNRIKHVVQQLCQAAELQEVTKANEKVFQVPGDKPWDSEKK